MRIWWGSLNARSRGLALHLLPRPALARVAASPSIEQLAAVLGRHGYEATWRHASSLADALEAGVNTRLAEHIAALWRWAGDAAEPLRAVIDDETRHTLRALVRGCVFGSSPEARQAASVATPDLDTATIARLAGARTMGELLAGLEAVTPVWIDALASSRTVAQPDVLALELRLTATLARRAREVARSGDAGLRRYVADRIDYENAVAALLLTSATAGDLDPADCFSAGGRRLSWSVYEEATTLPVDGARKRLAAVLGNSPAAAALAIPAAGETAAERFLDACIEDQRRSARLDPLSSAPTMLFLLEARAEAARLRRLLWGIALDRRPWAAAEARA